MNCTNRQWPVDEQKNYTMLLSLLAFVSTTAAIVEAAASSLPASLSSSDSRHAISIPGGGVMPTSDFHLSLEETGAPGSHTLRDAIKHYKSMMTDESATSPTTPLLLHQVRHRTLQATSFPTDPVMNSGSGNDFYCELSDYGDGFFCIRTTPANISTISGEIANDWHFPYRDYESFFACSCQLPLEPGVPNFTNENCDNCSVLFKNAEDDPNDDKDRAFFTCLSASFTNPTSYKNTYTIQFDCSNVFRLVGFDHTDEPCVGIDENGNCFGLFNVPAPTNVVSTYTIAPDETFCHDEPFEVTSSSGMNREPHEGRHLCVTYNGFPYPDTRAKTVFLCRDDTYVDNLDCICEVYMEFFADSTMCTSGEVHSNDSDRSLRVSFDCSNLFVGPTSAVSAPPPSSGTRPSTGGGSDSFPSNPEEGSDTDSMLNSVSSGSNRGSATTREEGGLSQGVIIAIVVSGLVLVIASVVARVFAYMFRLKMQNTNKREGMPVNNSQVDGTVSTTTAPTTTAPTFAWHKEQTLGSGYEEEPTVPPEELL